MQFSTATNVEALLRAITSSASAASYRRLPVGCSA
jgi:hypothetical protein